MDTLPYHFVGRTTDGLLIFQDLDYPADAPQSYVSDELLRRCSSTDSVFGTKYFAVTDRHAEVRGFLFLALGRQAGQCDGVGGRVM